MKHSLLLVFLSVIAFWGCKTPREKIIASQNLQLDTLKIDTTDLSCKEKENCPSLKFSYPFFKTDDDSLNAFLNKETQQILISHFDSSTTSVKRYVQSFFELYNQDKLTTHLYDDFTSLYYSDIEIKPTYKYNNFYTLTYNSDIFLGGAHPFGSQDFYVYDLNTLKKVKLSDIINTEDAALLKLGETYFRKSININDSLSLADAGYFVFGENIEDEDSPEYGKFRFIPNFAITDKGILFLYNHYEIAPYAAGIQSFEIPYNDLKPYLKIKF